MAGSLFETTVGEVCQVFDGPHATPPRLDSGPVFLGITSLNKGRIDLAASDHVSEDDFAKWTRRVTPQPGDVVFSYETKLGEAALIPEGLRCCLGRRMGLMRPDPQRLDSRFLLYYYLGPEFQDVIRERTIHGSTVERIALIEFPKFPLRIPPLAEQKAIAVVLCALDDKIELNRRMNATLEAVARALFQSWFVDFDPVRAKLDGRQPVGLDPATAALFPTTFQDSGFGHIPDGWEQGSILRQADLLSGGTPKTDVPTYWNGNVPWASAKDVSQCGEAFLVSTKRTITKQGVEESSTKIIPANATVVVARGATTGRLTMLGQAMAMNQTCYGLRSKVGAPFALYCNVRYYIERLVQGGHGSIFDTITTSTFESTDVLLAPKEILVAFDKQVAPLFQQVHANLLQSRTLATLRDTLLPKLLSGEITIPTP
jgi:type I restriction enzyme S subunit